MISFTPPYPERSLRSLSGEGRWKVDQPFVLEVFPCQVFSFCSPTVVDGERASHNRAKMGKPEHFWRSSRSMFTYMQSFLSTPKISFTKRLFERERRNSKHVFRVHPVRFFVSVMGFESSCSKLPIRSKVEKWACMGEIL